MGLTSLEGTFYLYIYTHISLINCCLYTFVHRQVFYVDNIKYKKRDNSHFMLVDGMSTLMTENVKNCESMDFRARGLKW